MPTGLLGVTRTGFVSPSSVVSVLRVTVQVDPGWVDVTTVEDTVKVLAQSEFVIYSGRLWGWCKTLGPPYDTLYGTLTIAAAAGNKILSGSAKLNRIIVTHDFGSKGGLNIPVIYDWEMTGGTVSVA